MKKITSKYFSTQTFIITTFIILFFDLFLWTNTSSEFNEDYEYIFPYILNNSLIIMQLLVVGYMFLTLILSVIFHYCSEEKLSVYFANERANQRVQLFLYAIAVNFIITFVILLIVTFTNFDFYNKINLNNYFGKSIIVTGYLIEQGSYYDSTYDYVDEHDEYNNIFSFSIPTLDRMPSKFSQYKIEKKSKEVYTLIDLENINRADIEIKIDKVYSDRVALVKNSVPLNDNYKISKYSLLNIIHYTIYFIYHYSVYLFLYYLGSIIYFKSSEAKIIKKWNSIL